MTFNYWRHRLQEEEREIHILLNAGEGSAEKLQEVEAAIERFNQGRFGYCVDCGGEILTERLRIFPQAARCLPCEEKAPRVLQPERDYMMVGEIPVILGPAKILPHEILGIFEGEVCAIPVQQDLPGRLLRPGIEFTWDGGKVTPNGRARLAPHETIQVIGSEVRAVPTTGGNSHVYRVGETGRVPGCRKARSHLPLE